MELETLLPKSGSSSIYDCTLPEGSDDSDGPAVELVVGWYCCAMASDHAKPLSPRRKTFCLASRCMDPEWIAALRLFVATAAEAAELLCIQLSCQAVKQVQVI